MSKQVKIVFINGAFAAAALVGGWIFPNHQNQILALFAILQPMVFALVIGDVQTQVARTHLQAWNDNQDMPK